MGRIGLFGGTFDPPHVGHLIMASVMADALELDAVWFVPAASPPHKQNRAVTPVEHRLAMLTLALAGDERFVLSRIDAMRPGPQFSVDMVTLAREQQPDAAFYFLMGSDSLRDLPSWHRPDALLEACTVAVLRRPDVVLDTAIFDRLLPDWRQRIIFVEGPGITLSSTLITKWVREGHSIRYLVPDAVRGYIAQHRLYQDFSP